MIELCNGRDVGDLLDMVTARPDEFRQVDLCAPFIDGGAVVRIVDLAAAASARRCGLRVVTSPGAAALLLSLLPPPAPRWRHTIVPRRGLHAKAYLAIGRGRRASVAIVTSANLTGAGLAGNVELGVRAVASTELGRRLIGEVRNFIGRLAA
jgi:hypothetical protein